MTCLNLPTDLGAVVDVLGRQRRRDDLAGVGVHANVRLAPRPARLGAVLLDQPLARAARAVQRSWTACTESTLQHMGGEMPKLMAQGIPEPANV